jgi:D-3-phosphoglycerate dehydrogenase
MMMHMKKREAAASSGAPPQGEIPLAKVLVTDALAPQGVELLEQTRGLEVLNKPGTSPEELLELIGDAEGLIIRSATKVTAEVFARAEKLKVVGRAGIGVDNVDVAAATEHGVVVVNTPEGNNITTAEHAIALMVSLARHIPQATASMKAGKWEKKKFEGMELYNRVLGVVGAGNIGRIVCLRGVGLGMKVVVYDPFITAEAAARLGVELVSFDELLERADVITVHVPKTKGTTGLLNKAAFAKCKDGVFVINAARGGIVDEEALLEALNSGRVAGAGLDVFVEEPPPEGHPLVSHPNVICTPHLGASTEQAQVNVSVAVAEQVRDFLLDGIVRNSINVPSVSPEMMEEVQPYLTLASKIGSFHGQLAAGPIDQIEVEYAGEIAELNIAPITIAALHGLLSPSHAAVNMVNAPVVAQQLGIKLIETKSNRPRDFASAITMTVRGKAVTASGRNERLISGAIFHGDQPRIVRIDDFMLEAIPEGCTLLVHNHDQAGVVGTVGTILGEAKVNISRMQLALVRSRKEAAMLVNIDNQPPDSVIEQIRAVPNVISVQLVEL